MATLVNLREMWKSFIFTVFFPPQTLIFSHIIYILTFLAKPWRGHTLFKIIFDINFVYPCINQDVKKQISHEASIPQCRYQLISVDIGYWKSRVGQCLDTRYRHIMNINNHYSVSLLCIRHLTHWILIDFHCSKTWIFKDRGDTTGDT